MGDISIRTFTCVDCYQEQTTSALTGPTPRRCCGCKKVYKRALQVEYVKAQREGVPRTTTFTCVDCRSNFPLPTVRSRLVRCDPCREQLSPGPCSVDDCDYPIQNVRHQVCSSHIKRVRKHGSPLAHVPLRTPHPERMSTCAAEGCERSTESGQTSLCGAHRDRMDRHGSVREGEAIRIASVTGLLCKVPNCGEPVQSLNLCKLHYCRQWRTGDVQADKPRKFFRPVNPGGVCEEPGCDYLISHRQYCPKHRHPAALFCTAKGCIKLAKRRDLCTAHSTRLLRWGSLATEVPVRVPPKYNIGDPCVRPQCGKPITWGEQGLCAFHRWRKVREVMRADPVKLEAWRAAARVGARAARLKDPVRFKARTKAYRLRWRAANPEKARATDAKRNARRRAAMKKAPKVHYTATQLAERMRYWGDRCWMCHGPFQAVDHVKPITKGGYDALGNLRPICASCNGSKNNRWPFPVSASPARPSLLSATA
jgi:hypothetical protein